VTATPPPARNRSEGRASANLGTRRARQGALVARGLGISALLIVACGASPSRTPSRVIGDGATPVSARSWLDAVARTCALAASCAHLHDGPGLVDPGACVDGWLSHAGPGGRKDALHRCLLAATTCEAVDACTRERGDARAAAFCGAHVGTITGCDGDRLVTCTGDDVAESTAVDCAALSARCGEVSLPGGLVARGCFSASLCPPSAPDARCDGATAIVACHDGAVERFGCEPGARCEEHADADGERTASCEAPAEARCEQPGARRCEGDRLVMCEPSGHFGRVRRTDCAALGLRCAARGERSTCESGAAQAGRGCDRGAARCDGEALAFCAAGAPARVSCASLGLGACDPDARGARAACGAKAR
jgi:hypothetical protein